MQNKLPNVWINPEQFQDQSCVDAFVSLTNKRFVEYVPKEKLDIALARISELEQRIKFLLDDPECELYRIQAKEALKEIGE